MTQKSVPILDYGRRSALRRYLRFAKWAAALVAAIVTSYLLRPQIHRTLKSFELARALRRCESHTEPPATLVFDSGSSINQTWGQRWQLGPKFPAPADWVYVRSKLRDTLYSNSAPLIFLHKLQSAKGTRRLVAVELERAVMIPRGPVVIAVYTLDSAAGAQVRTMLVGTADSLDNFERFRPTKVYAGQCDPVDASHFTVVYETAEGLGTLDGHLEDNGVASIKVRDGPSHAMHDAFAAVEQHPEDIDNHLRLQDLAWTREWWSLPRAYDDFVLDHHGTRKGKLWRLLIVNQFRYYRPDGRFRPQEIFRQVAAEPGSPEDGPLDRLTPAEVQLGLKLLDTLSVQWNQGRSAAE